MVRQDCVLTGHGQGIWCTDWNHSCLSGGLNMAARYFAVLQEIVPIRDTMGLRGESFLCILARP